MKIRLDPPGASPPSPTDAHLRPVPPGLGDDVTAHVTPSRAILVSDGPPAETVVRCGLLDSPSRCSHQRDRACTAALPLCHPTSTERAIGPKPEPHAPTPRSVATASGAAAVGDGDPDRHARPAVDGTPRQLRHIAYTSTSMMPFGARSQTRGRVVRAQRTAPVGMIRAGRSRRRSGSANQRPGRSAADALEVPSCVVRIDVGGGVRLFVDVDGPGVVADGPVMRERSTLLLLHGGPAMDSSIFRGSGLDELIDVAQVVYYDQRRGPQRPAVTTGVDAGDVGRRRVPAVRRAWREQASCAWGDSFGGMVAQRYLARHPDLAGR